MEVKVYTRQKPYTLKDGTVKYCESRYTYTPKGTMKTGRTRGENSVSDIVYDVRHMSPDEVARVRAFVKDLKDARQKINNTQ